VPEIILTILPALQRAFVVLHVGSAIPTDLPVEKPVDQHGYADEYECDVQQSLVIMHIPAGQQPENGPNDNNGKYARYDVDIHGNKCLRPKIIFSILAVFF
jgi:hypothetical protein